MAGSKTEHRTPALAYWRRDKGSVTTVVCSATYAGDVHPLWSVVVEWKDVEGRYLEEQARVSGDAEHETYASCFVYCFQNRKPEDRTPQGLINRLLERGFVLKHTSN